MKARVIIGANCGDESKGTIVARYTRDSENVLNVLTNGGAQRGHSILTKDGNITYKHFGSGTYFGADSYYSRYFILNPVQFAKEHKDMIVKPKKVYRDPICRWTTIYDMFANLISEHMQHRHASCCMGIWNTVRRSMDQMPPLFDAFMYFTHAQKREYLKKVKEYYEKEMVIPDEYKKVWDDPALMDHFIEDCWYMYRNTEVIQLKDLKYDNLIFENGQGLLLSDTGADIYDTTPSNTGIKYSLDLLSEFAPGTVESVTAHYVSRTYLTRHGDGYLDGESSRKFISSDIKEDRTNQYNEFQGGFRYGVIADVNDIYDRVKKDAGNVNFELELTHCDEFDNVNEFKRRFDVVHTYDTALV